MPSRIDKTVVRRIRRGEKKSDASYWRSQSPIARLEALEEIRKEYNSWKYGTKQRLQRVLTIVKR